MAVRAVIFDWGGTLTPWHHIDHELLWQEVCEPHFPGRACEIAKLIRAAEQELWRRTEQSRASATLAEVFDHAGVTATEALFESLFTAWEPHTLTHPEAAGVLAELRRRGLKIGVLSNTMWPRSTHERIFLRDEVLHLIDGAVYSSEIPWAKPHPGAFWAAMAAIGEDDPAACVFVGDRPYDDVHGAKQLGMRAVLVEGSDVPGFTSTAPDAVITSLPELLGHLDGW